MHDYFLNYEKIEIKTAHVCNTLLVGQKQIFEVNLGFQQFILFSHIIIWSFSNPTQNLNLSPKMVRSNFDLIMRRITFWFILRNARAQTQTQPTSAYFENERE